VTKLLNNICEAALHFFGIDDTDHKQSDAYRDGDPDIRPGYRQVQQGGTDARQFLIRFHTDYLELSVPHSGFIKFRSVSEASGKDEWVIWGIMITIAVRNQNGSMMRTIMKVLTPMA
jgi:hypothetical protein